MFGFILAIIIALIVGLILGFCSQEVGKSIYAGIITFIFICTMYCAIVIFGLGNTLAIEVPDERVDTLPVYALQDNHDTSGNISGVLFYQSEILEGNLNYYFITKENDKKIIKHIPADKTFINETNDVPPSVEYHYCKKTHSPVMTFFTFPFLRDEIKEDTYVLNVPEKTLSTDLKIDMQ